MRALLVTWLCCVLAACGGSSKKSTPPRVDDNSRGNPAEASRSDQRDRGDTTLTTNTGDDLSWLAPVYFPFDSVELTASTRDTLAKLHAWLGTHPKTVLTIEGHCDEQWTTEYNVALGQRRAQAMADYLGRLGTASSRINTISFGAERPVVDGHDEVAWSKNRRGEFRVGP